MDYRFKADEWQHLSALERVRRCRLMAEEAMTLAESAPSALKDGYLSIAGEWLKLATDIERTMS